MNKGGNDIDELKRENAHLKNQLARSQSSYYTLVKKTNQDLKNLFDNSTDLIAILKDTGEIRFANSAVKNKLGYNQEEISHLKFIEIVHPDNRQALKDTFKNIPENQFEQFETVLISKTGKNIYVTGSLTFIIEDNEIAEYRCVLYDITERIRTESAQSLYAEIGNITITENNLDQLYTDIYHQLNRLLQVQNFQISFKEEKKYRQVFYINENSKRSKSFDTEQILMDYTLQRNQSIICYSDGVKKISKQLGVKINGSIPKIWLGIIIRTANKMGVMSICHYHDSSAFNNQDLELLNYIGGQVSLATERQHKEEKIENQAATLSAIFDSSIHEIWSVNKKLRLTSYNQKHEIFLKKNHGINPKIGLNIKKEIFNSFTKEIEDIWTSKYNEAFSGRFVNFQTNSLDISGKEVWKDVFINPVFLQNGHIEELSIMTNDITEKKEFESILIASEEKFRAIFESFQDIYFRCDTRGEIIMISPSVHEVIGYRADKIINTNVLDYAVKSIQILRIRKRIDTESKIRNEEVSLKTADGKSLPFLFNIRRINKDDGTIDIEVIAKDISQLKKTNEELKKAKEMAERLLKIKERFLENMSHEIRTPMNGIIGMIDLLASTRLSREQSDYVKTINKSSQTLLNILNDVLDLSKIEAGKIRLRQQPIHLVKTTEKIYDFFSQQASTKNNNIYYHIDEKTPQWIMGDETRLIQIISNLISNAIKFSESTGNINLSIRVKRKEDKQFLFKVEIKDSGIGISKEDQKKLFQRFIQLDNSRSKNFGGTGLGLAICKELIKSMHGEIGVVSTPGLGSTFWFTFTGTEVTPDKVNITQPDKPFKKEFMARSPKILLVDDNEINLKVAKAIMTKSGCEVEDASDGFQAIEKAGGNNFDLIFMDIQMPKMDGIIATSKIRKLKIGKKVPIIAMTAYSMEDDQERFLQAGLDDYLAKPIKAIVLINMIKKWVSFEPLKVSQGVVLEKKEDLAINQNTLNQLIKFGGQELIEETLIDFEKEAKQLIHNTDTFLKEKAYEKMLGELHTLKGNAGTLGIEKISKQASDIEKEIKNDRFDDLESKTSYLKILFQEFKENSKHLLINNP